MYDLILKNATVVDPATDTHTILDIGIKDGLIASRKSNLDTQQTRRVIDIQDRTAIPGIIDSHAHFSRNDQSIGQNMMVRKGVTTAIDFCSTPEELGSSATKTGVGLNVGCLYPLIPSQTLSSSNPFKSELKSVIETAIRKGALGIKLVGGHYPISPRAATQAMDIANSMGVYIASHVGTTESSSDLTGLRELAEMVGDHRIHIAHINSYCRGRTDNPIEEAQEAIEILSQLGEHIVCESYLGTINGTNGECESGEPISHVTRNCLRDHAYSPTRDGLKQAIEENYCYVIVEQGGENVLVSGSEGINLWEAARTNTKVSFPVNSPQATFLLATAKKDDHFVVDAISTDGGAYPRNHIVDRGLALVRYGALTLEDFVRKVSTNPARMFGLTGKGHLEPGSDADITVLDTKAGQATMSIIQGNIAMIDGVEIPQKATILTTERCQGNDSFDGLNVHKVDMKKSLLYTR